MNSWILKTNNGPLAAVRQFLQSIWTYADLEGMAVLTCQPGNTTVKTILINDPAQLEHANPFAPLMQFNAGKLVAELAHEMPDMRLAIVLRPCELRALDERIKIDALHLERWLLIGVECLGCFPPQDFEWRIQNAGGIEKLTDLVLRNARQGGIALDRFRSACQICSQPEPSHYDLCLQLLGLPVKELMLVSTRDEAVARKIHLDEIADGPAMLDLRGQHDLMIKIVEERRQRSRERKIRELFTHLPTNLDQLTNFLMQCQPCKKCIEACPAHTEELVSSINHGAISRYLARRWLMSCAECGMCEEACPRGMPLAAIMNHISRNLKSETVTV